MRGAKAHAMQQLLLANMLTPCEDVWTAETRLKLPLKEEGVRQRKSLTTKDFSSSFSIDLYNHPVSTKPLSHLEAMEKSIE